ncbi:DUF3119 family protein [Ancylothrix sp. C2]|uniref:DUF3119 family protein n=1 Tax=Ancylothrix sp. D3o TaxID=2953691 RepID=UPI0021BB9954|nr:DUF3119 family protein [Ancylothrix sp. D3o]MCT7948338.1 DUF3119 family protein [Ancylothrix sp. D3o]
MTISTSSVNATQTVELSPSYAIPLVLVISSVPFFVIQPWVAGLISLFGLFLMIQSATIRLKFTDTALDVYRSDKLIRRFPYAEWENWRVFWPALPILFYFKEVKSIHFLPVLFDAKMLQVCLEQRCPRK